MSLPAIPLTDIVVAVGVHLWQTTLILLPLLVLARLMRSAPAGAIHALWTVCFLKLFIPFSPVGRWVGDVSVFPFSQWGGWLRPIEGAAWLGPVTALMNPGLKIDPVGIDGHADLLSAAAFGWVLCVVLLVLFWIGRDRAEVRLKSGGTIPLDRGLERKLSRTLLDCAVPRGAVRVVHGGSMPFVTGLLRPVICMPPKLIAHLEEDELRGIVLHENAHRRRFDPLRRVAHRIAVSLFFYYPLLWPILRQLRDSGEMVCDKAALRSDVAPAIFARALARTISLGLVPSPSHAAADGRCPSLIRKRFSRLEDPGRYRLMWKHRIAAISCAAVLLAGTLVPVANSELIAMEEEVAPPVPIHKVKPLYPLAERKAGVEGYVVLQVVVEVDGSVGSISVLEGVEDHKSFEENSIRAMKEWRFEQAGEERGDRAFQLLVPFEFHLK